MTGRVKEGVAIAVGASVTLALGGLLWFSRPFQAEVGSYRTSLASRTDAQRHNIRQAAMTLDGVVIEPAGILSFNQVVGPRSPERGYLKAPSYMERDLVASVGGGICQVSSTFYNAAVLSGLDIIERHPHSRLVRSVPPGCDATVWFGLADLVVRNPYTNPVRIKSLAVYESLLISIVGSNGDGTKVLVRTEPVVAARSQRVVYRTTRSMEYRGKYKTELISMDIYD